MGYHLPLNVHVIFLKISLNEIYIYREDKQTNFKCGLRIFFKDLFFQNKDLIMYWPQCNFQILFTVELFLFI